MKRFFLAFLICAWPLAAEVKVTREGDRVAVEIDGQPFTALYMGKDTTKPYLHPLRAASRTIVTRGYPMEPTEGERKDHIHQRGLWFTHGDVNGFDFWGNDPTQQSPKKGRIVLNKVQQVKSGNRSGTIQASFDWLDAQGGKLLTEARKMVFHAHPTLRIVDLEITLEAAREVKFGDTKEGTFAIRLAAWMEEPDQRAPAAPKRTGKMVNAEGLQTERNAWGKRSPWMDYCGEKDGEKLGVAIFDHPGNPKHPTFWHSRGYGLFAANIFGERDFLRDKQRDGSVTLTAGGKLRFRYRVVIHPGDTASANIAGLYQEYAAGK
jgi:hypothetical protein